MSNDLFKAYDILDQIRDGLGMDVMIGLTLDQDIRGLLISFSNVEELKTVPYFGIDFDGCEPDTSVVKIINFVIESCIDHMIKYS